MVRWLFHTRTYNDAHAPRLARRIFFKRAWHAWRLPARLNGVSDDDTVSGDGGDNLDQTTTTVITDG